MNTDQSKANTRATARGLVGKAVGAILLALLGALLIPVVLQEESCKRFAFLGNHVRILCGETYRHATETDAEAVMMSYFSLVGGSDPQRAYRDRLSADFRESVEKEDFLDEWSPVSWAEVRTVPRPVDGRFNVFSLTVRHYETAGNPESPAEGRIVDRTRVVGLRFNDGEWRINEDRAGNRIQDMPVKFVSPVMPSAHVTYHNAYVDENNVALPLSQQLPTGGSLAVLCALDEKPIDQSSRDSVELWYRTPQGWLPAMAMPKANPSRMLDCDPRYFQNG